MEPVLAFFRVQGLEFDFAVSCITDIDQLFFQMNTIPVCPKELPAELSDALELLAQLWAESPLRPRPPSAVVQAWDSLIESWIEDPELPLLIRKVSGNRGNALEHKLTHRTLIPTDNSPAHWAYALALRGCCPSLDELRGLLAQKAVPVAMILTRAEQERAVFRRTLRREEDLNCSRWKLAHIKRIGLKTRTPLPEIGIETLEAHFRELMQPSNMFLMPLGWAGLAEVEVVINAVKKAGIAG